MFPLEIKYVMKLKLIKNIMTGHGF